MPRVSILLPAYNAATTIDFALASAQSQTLADIEILVIDDGSQDETANLVRERSRLDRRIRLIMQECNRGPAAARNRGISVATGEWLALLDADDTMTSDRIEKLLERASALDVLVADNIALFDCGAGKVVGLGIDPQILVGGLRVDCQGFAARCKTHQPNAIDFGLLKPLIRTSHIRRHGIIYDESIRYGEDFRFYLDVLLAGGKLLVLPESGYRYTERTGSISGKQSGLSQTVVRHDQLGQQAMDLAHDPRYAAVAHHLVQRANAIRRLARIISFRQRSLAGKLGSLPAILADRDMRKYFASRIIARFSTVRFSQWSKSTLIRDSSNLCVGQGLKLVLQAVYFFCIARFLGPAQYGAFVAVTAVTSIVSPYIGLGCGSLFLKNVRAGRRTAPVCWGNGLLSTAVTGSLAAVILSALSHWWLPGLPTLLVGAISFSDLILMRIIDLASFGFAASGKMRKTAVQNTTMSLLRVLGILFLILYERTVSVQAWTWVYLATGIVGALFALQQGTALWRRAEISLVELWEDAKEGCFFSISTSAQTIYNDIDKTMLARLSTFSATGVYAAAYRIIDTSLTPVRSLVSAAYPQFFRVGNDGIEATYSFAKNLIRKAMVFGVADFLGLMILAPVLPHILGPKYAAVSPTVRLLALIPVMRCVHWFLADALSGASAQALRTSVQAGVALFNVGLNLLILPRWSWVGAAWTSVASDAVLATAIYAAVQWKRASQTKTLKPRMSSPAEESAVGAT